MFINSSLIKTKIANLGLTQKQFAEKAGLSRVGFNSMLIKQTCHPNSLIKIAKALDVEPAELLRTEVS